ncbi:MAG: class I SAM-dependent methyltransferase [Mucinivorans sp.]
MTQEELTLLQSDDSKLIIEQSLSAGLSAERVALTVRCPAIATQIKYLGRAAKKLPAFYASRCIIDRQGYEQCSSQATASSKFESLQGNIALDLTAGLGVDSYALSLCFDRVISVEMNDLRAALTAYNFRLLGADNIEVVCSDAESFLLSNPDLQADLIYIDPSRIAENSTAHERVFSIEDSSPNVLKIMQLMRRIAPRIIIKLSPLFDVDECFNRFGSAISVEVVSLNNECKEVLVKIGFDQPGVIVNTILKGNSKAQYTFNHCNDCRGAIGSESEAFDPKYLYVPDVAFVKTRTLVSYISLYYPLSKCNTEGYVLSQTRLPNFAGQEFEITSIEQYQPKLVKKILKVKGVKRATIAHHLFPYSTAKILRDLQLKEGGSEKLFFSVYKQKPTVFFVSSSENQSNG